MNNLRTNRNDVPEDTGQKLDTRFRPGQSGNPAGRPRGSRNKLAADFIDGLHEKFQEHGVQAIEKVAKDEPATFLKIVAGLLPRETVISALNVSAHFDLSDMEEAKGFFEAYSYARQRIGAVPPEPAIIDLTAEAETAWRIDDED